MILEQKVLVFELFSDKHLVSNELERAGLPRDVMAVVADYDLALHTLTQYPIRAAVLHVPGSIEYAPATRQLHSALRRPNPYVDIYHVVSIPLQSIAEMQQFGLLSLTVTGLVPAQFGGKVEENKLCQLGLQLYRKYFSIAQA